MLQSTDVSGSFQARLIDTSAALAVGQFVSLPDTPGNVGVCLSGGGSRALSAGMGQLRALSYLQLGGKSLLSQTKALSTVSGGSWLGVTFEYLTADTSDDNYLNQYVPDPGRLVPTRTAGHTTPEILAELPPGNIGNAINTRLFSVPGLAVEAYILYKYCHTPPNLLWQTLIGLHILKPYGLYVHGPGMQPTSLFSWDGPTLAADVTGPNPDLGSVSAHLVASATDPSRTRRPYLACNSGMFLNEPGSKVCFLAPVQATPFLTGIVGAPTGTDANGRTPGGGGVSSFAFSSNPMGVQEAGVTVAQARQLALADIMGTSSAAFANALENQFANWEQEPGAFFQQLAERADEIRNWLDKHLPRLESDRVKAFLDAEMRVGSSSHLAELKADFAKLQDLIPEYQYWPVAGVQPSPQTLPTRFADGGNLENLGLNAMLAYSDVDTLIVFANTSTPLGAGDRGMINTQGQEVPDTRVIVTSDIPPLFGYQPYQPGVGYVLYEGATDCVFPQGKNSQVFDSTAFADVLQGLWQASGSGTNATPAVYTQTLAVQPNPWFGVRGDRTVDVLWVHLNAVRAWYDLLAPSVQSLLGPFDDPTAFSNFPHYSTFKTDLNPTEINLLASLTAWTVAADANKEVFLGRYV